jgi:hypothetical protein
MHFQCLAAHLGAFGFERGTGDLLDAHYVAANPTAQERSLVTIATW